MKKIFYILSIAAVALFASCAKEEIGGTACQDMAGQWYVTCDLIDAAGEVMATGADFFGLDERFMVLTYNTAANDPKEMILDDCGNFWEFSCKIACDPAGMTFSAKDAVDYMNDDKVTVTGKIVKDGTETPSGMPADYIEMVINFGSDEYPKEYGYAAYKLSGWRYTGFENDD